MDRVDTGSGVLGFLLALLIIAGMGLVVIALHGDVRTSRHETPHGCYVITEASDGFDFEVADVERCS